MRSRNEGHDGAFSGAGSSGGAFETTEQLRSANAEKLQELLNRTAHRTAAARAASGRRSDKRTGALTGDYLDFDGTEFGGRWMNIMFGVLIAFALVLFYVLWFTDWVR